MTKAEEFKNIGVEEFDNDGWTDNRLTKDPENFGGIVDDSQPMARGWRFPDGSELWLTPGQKTTSIMVLP